MPPATLSHDDLFSPGHSDPLHHQRSADQSPRSSVAVAFSFSLDFAKCRPDSSKLSPSARSYTLSSLGFRSRRFFGPTRISFRRVSARECRSPVPWCSNRGLAVASENRPRPHNLSVCPRVTTSVQTVATVVVVAVVGRRTPGQFSSLSRVLLSSWSDFRLAKSSRSSSRFRFLSGRRSSSSSSRRRRSRSGTVSCSGGCVKFSRIFPRAKHHQSGCCLCLFQ